MDIVCLRNISINTLPKGDGDGDGDGDDDGDDDDDDDDDNNNNVNLTCECGEQVSFHLFPTPHVFKYTE